MPPLSFWEEESGSVLAGAEPAGAGKVPVDGVGVGVPWWVCSTFQKGSKPFILTMVFVWMIASFEVKQVPIPRMVVFLADSGELSFPVAGVMHLDGSWSTQ
ncbi:hypothetical protein L7F22_046007, partial [Adiantum nelumboides]|nr:hypothetical protein [Adiantum nelumboides]